MPLVPGPSVDMLHGNAIDGTFVFQNACSPMEVTKSGRSIGIESDTQPSNAPDPMAVSELFVKELPSWTETKALHP